MCGVTGDPSRWVHSGNVPPAIQVKIAQKARSLARSRAGVPTTSAFVYILAVFSVVYITDYIGDLYHRPARIAAAVAIGAIIAYAVYRRVRDDRTTRFTVAAFLGEGRCPSCGYDLTGIEPAGDGCTVCPECGAAWRLAPTQPKSG